VATLHLLVLWSGWDDSTSEQAASPLPPGAVYVPATVLAPPVKAPAPPARRAAAGPRPAPSVAPGAAGPATEASGGPAPETATPTTPFQEASAQPASADAPSEAAPEAQEQHQPAPAPQQSALALPPPLRLSYVIEGQSRGLGYSAGATLDWRQDGQRYEAQMEIRAFLLGSRSQTSTGRLDADGLQPERFVDRARRQRITVFDRAAGQLRQEDAGASFALTSGVQDKLSVFLQLAAQLAALPQAPPTGLSLIMPVAASSALEAWQFRFEAVEDLDLPAGHFLTWKFSRAPLRAGDAGLELWAAPALAFLPVRIRLQQDNGDSVDQRLSRP
jgi:hypothetical protein